MSIPNSPAGVLSGYFSSFHRGSPDPDALRLYLEEEKHDGVMPLHPLLKELVCNAERKTVLDVGCGLGSVFCEALLYYGLCSDNLYSLDIDPLNFEVDEYPRVHKILGSVEHIGLESNMFDVVHSNEMTLDNVHIDFVQALREICRVLKPGCFYLANEHFDEMEEMRKTNPAVLTKSQPFGKIIDDERLLDSIGFKPVVRIKYIDGENVGKYQFVVYLFQKI